MRKKYICMALAALIALVGLAACGPRDDIGDDDSDDLTKKVTFNVWMPLEPWSVSSFTNRDFGENEVIRELEKKFNVEFKFTHPSTGSEQEQFSLMMTDKTLPDLIFMPGWYSGGIETGIREKAYRDLTMLVPQYMPNYARVLEQNPEIKSLALTDSKQIGALYGVSLYEEYPYYGPIFKKKWLEDVGEQVPVTVADWERVLTKFKQQKNASTPFILDPAGYDYTAGTFLSAYGVAPAFYLDGGEVKFGPMEDGFYQYLNLMRDWINKGLVSQNFSEKDWNDIRSLITSPAAGALMQSPDTMSVEFENAGISWVAAPYPVLESGDTLHYRQKSFQVYDGWMTAAAISTSCKSVKRLMMVLDYGYSEAGAELFNFGIEGRAYEKDPETGEKQFTDLIYNNEYGLTPLQTVWRYKVHNGLFIRDEHHANPILIQNEQSLSARESWSKIPADAVVPPLSYTRTESQNVSRLMTSVNNYLKKQVLAFLTGAENDLSKTDVVTDPTVFRSNLAKNGVNDVLEIVVAAYARYLER